MAEPRGYESEAKNKPKTFYMVKVFDMARRKMCVVFCDKTGKHAFGQADRWSMVVAETKVEARFMFGRGEGVEQNA